MTRKPIIVTKVCALPLPIPKPKRGPKRSSAYDHHLQGARDGLKSGIYRDHEHAAYSIATKEFGHHTVEGHDALRNMIKRMLAEHPS